MDPMQLLARIYDLLSQCSSKELEQAAGIVGEDTALSEALQLLVVYKRSSPQNKKGKTLSPKVRIPKKTTVKPGARRLTGNLSKATKSSNNGVRKKFMDVVLNKEIFKTNRDVSLYFLQLNIPVPIDPKDSRKRILNKVLIWLDNLPPEKQKEAYSLLLEILGPSETAGWFDVIRGSKT